MSETEPRPEVSAKQTFEGIRSVPVSPGLPAQENDERKQAEVALRAIVEGVEAETGDRFFPLLVQHLAAALGVQYSFVSEISEDRKRFRTLAVWGHGTLLPNFEIPLAGTPCEAVLHGRMAHFPERLQALFPEDKGLADWQAESYCGVPLLDSSGTVVGHLAIIHDKPMPDGLRSLSIMRIFAVRARAELDRKRLEEALRRNEERYRDLFDEAPIAYVHEGLDSRFIRVNRAAMRILGITPDEIAGTYGKSFIPDTPDAQRRVREALESIGRGTDTSGVVLELRRRDNGKPLWIQWWSKPDPSGTYTRTMFLDITDRVLMEQEKARLEAQNTYLQEEIQSNYNFEEIIGKAASLKKTLKNVERVAPTDSTILITGETGTGKELIARAIHNLSSRKGRPLVKVNCAAIPAGLIESELFGHEKGAFTGATARKKGRFELADEGTVFLDEVGELPLETQMKLLRVLQEQEFERVGGTQTISVDVRVIAATNRNLEEAVRLGAFRSDLFYRLNIFPIHLPPLRDRVEDVPLLIDYFIRKFSRKMGKRVDRVGPEALERLMGYHWPGNVRELANIIERAVILCDGPAIQPDQIHISGAVPEKKDEVLPLEEAERLHILKALEKTGGMVGGPKGAAALLGINRTTLISRMQKLGINPKLKS